MLLKKTLASGVTNRGMSSVTVKLYVLLQGNSFPSLLTERTRQYHVPFSNTLCGLNKHQGLGWDSMVLASEKSLLRERLNCKKSACLVLLGTSSGEGFIYKVCSCCGYGVSRTFSCIHRIFSAWMVISARLQPRRIRLVFSYYVIFDMILSERKQRYRDSMKTAYSCVKRFAIRV